MTEYITSRHLVTWERNGKLIFYHALVGNSFQGNQRVQDLFEVLRTPHSLEMLASVIKSDIAQLKTALDELVGRKMIVPVRDDVPQEVSGDDPSLQHYPLRLLRLYVTKTCNMACTYCFEKNHDGPKMSLETASNAVRAFREWLDSGADTNGRELVKINFFGGEPLVCLPRLKETVPIINKAMEGFATDWRITMNSNATLINRDTARWIVDNRIHVYTSLDGLKEGNDQQRIFRGGRGTFDAVRRGLQELVTAGDDEYCQEYLSVLCTVSPKNLPEIELLADALYDIGVRNLAFNSAFNCTIHQPDETQGQWTTLSRSELEEFVERVTALQARMFAKDFHIGGMWGHVPERLRRGGTIFCQAIGNEIGVDHANNLYACPTTLDVPSGSIGNLSNEGQFIFNDRAEQWRQRTSNNLPACQDCDLQGICRGGCPAASILSGREMDEPSQCAYWFDIVDAYLSRQNLSADSTAPIVERRSQS